MKKIILITIMLITLVGCAGNSKPVLNDLLDSIVYDAYESTATFSMISEGEINNKLIFEYTVSEENNYIKMVKEINDDLETNIIYNKDDVFYLYQNKNDSENTIELTNNTAFELIDQIIEQRDFYYSISSTDATSYTSNVKDAVTTVFYAETIEDIYYDIQVSYNTSNMKFVGLSKVFTQNNTMTTIELNISYTLDMTIPGGTL